MTPAQRPLYGAIDLGGTKVRAVVADLNGQIYGEEIGPSAAQEGLDPVVNRIVESMLAALKEAGARPEDLRAVGIASPGPVDAFQGIVPWAPQLPGWRDVPLVDIISERLGVSACLENDANAAALGENRYGAGRGTQHMVYITVSTGLGGGIIVGGELYRGANGSAGEIGHLVLDPDGPECGCGGRGHLEAFSSGTAIGRRGAEAADNNESEALARLLQDEGRVTAATVMRAAKGGDKTSIRIFEEAGYYLGLGLAGIVNVFNPEAIVIGGGVTAAADFFIPRARQVMEETAMSEPLKRVRIEMAALGDRGGVLGMIARLRDIEGESVRE